MQQVARWIAGAVSVLVLLVVLLALLFSLSSSDPEEAAREAPGMGQPEVLSSTMTNGIRGGTATVTLRDEADAKPERTITLRRPFWSRNWQVESE